MSGSIDQFKLSPLTLAIRRETQHKGGFLGKVLRIVVPIAIPFIAPAILPISGIFGKLALNMGLGALTSKISGGNPLTGALLAGAGTIAGQAIGGLKNLPKSGGGTISTAAGNVANPSGFAFMGGAGQTGAALANNVIPNVTTALDAAGNVIGTTGFNPTALNSAGQTLSSAANAGNLLPTSAGVRGIDSPQFFNQGVSPVPQVNPNNLGLNTVSPDITNTLLSTDPNTGRVPLPTDVRNVQTFANTPVNNLSGAPTTTSDGGFLDQVNQNRNVNVGPDGRTIASTQSTPAGENLRAGTLEGLKRDAKKIFGKAADNLIANPNRLMSVLTGLASDNLTDLTDEEKQMIADRERRQAELARTDAAAHARQEDAFNQLISAFKNTKLPGDIGREAAAGEAIRLEKLKRQTLRSTNPRRDREAEFIARQFDLESSRGSAAAFGDAFSKAEQARLSGLAKITNAAGFLPSDGARQAADDLDQFKIDAENRRVAKAQEIAKFGGALFDFDDPLKKKEEEEVPA